MDNRDGGGSFTGNAETKGNNKKIGILGTGREVVVRKGSVVSSWP